MNKLFVPFDFSVYAENALLYAVSMARRIEASVTVFHIMQVPVPAGYEDASLTYNMAIATQEKKKVAERLSELLAVYRESFYVGTSTPVKFDIEIRQSGFEEGIGNYLKHNAHHMIVMGTKGLQGWEEMLEESNTASLSRQVGNSMLVVPLEASFEGISNIVYASNFDAKDMKLLKDITSFNDFFGGNVTCLHVANSKEQGLKDLNRMNALEAAVEKHKLENVKFEIVVDESVEKGLFNYATEINADILAVKPQEHGVIGSIFHKSVTRQLTHHTSIPLLIVK